MISKRTLLVVTAAQETKMPARKSTLRKTFKNNKTEFYENLNNHEMKLKKAERKIYLQAYTGAYLNQ